MNKIFISLLLVVFAIKSFSLAETSPADTTLSEGIIDSVYKENKEKDFDSISIETKQILFPALIQEFDEQSKEKRDTVYKDRVHYDAELNKYLKEEYKNVRKAYTQNLRRRTYYYDSLYLANKIQMDAGRERHFISPYQDNFGLCEVIDDSTDAGRKKNRIAIKFQISQKIPVAVHKYYNTGLYLAMTFRGLFDIGNRDDSRPVSRKTFMPEGYITVDLASFSMIRWLRWLGNIFPPERDRNVIQWGLQHESNGGKGIYSRGIIFRHYVSYNFKFLPVKKRDSKMGVFTDQYKNSINVRLFWLHGIADNPDIKHYIGFMDMRWDYQFSPFKRGIYGLSFWLNPSFSKDDWKNFDHTSFFVSFNYTFPWNLKYRRYTGANPFKHLAYSMHLPVSVYFRYWNGHNEYLLKYRKRTETKVVGFGILLRR